MNQIKIFEGHGNNADDVNEFLKQNPDVEVTNVILTQMHDNYSDGQICNQWIATTIVYKTT